MIVERKQVPLLFPRNIMYKNTYGVVYKVDMGRFGVVKWLIFYTFKHGVVSIPPCDDHLFVWENGEQLGPALTG